MVTMHRLQQHILQKLILNPELRYSQIKPKDVEGNLFMYHLKHLLREGTVEKGENGLYRLSADGKLYADQLSLKSFARRMQPRIVTLMAVENEKGEWLFYRRKKQPMINMIGFPYGKIHLGESIQSAAERELMEKTGLNATLKHIGDGYAVTLENAEPISEIMFHMFYGSNPSGKLIRKSKIGESLWVKPEEVGGKGFMPNVTELLKLVKSGDQTRRFFAELSHKL